MEIGISVLRADPKKEPSAAAARKWALDLIDANAGGVRFSDEARRQLIEEALTVKSYTHDVWYDTYTPDAPLAVPKKNSN